MKFIQCIALFLGLSMIAQHTHTEATLTCIYKQKFHPADPLYKSKIHKNATGIGCKLKCAENDGICKNHLFINAKGFCNEFHRVPSGYELFRTKIVCEDNTVFEYDYPQE